MTLRGILCARMLRFKVVQVYCGIKKGCLMGTIASREGNFHRYQRRENETRRNRGNIYVSFNHFSINYYSFSFVNESMLSSIINQNSAKNES